MDISALSLPLRKDRPQRSLFGVRPSITSVNVSYETAAGNSTYENNEDSRDSASRSNENTSENTNSDDSSSKTSADPSGDGVQEQPSEGTQPESSQSESVGSPRSNKLYESVPASLSGSPTGSTHEFPAKENSPQKEKHLGYESQPMTPTKSSVMSARRRRARSSFSVASVECQSFVASLKEPKYAKPLTADEIAWIFQDFYLKLRTEILGSEDEMLSKEEQEARKEAELDIDVVLDKAEKAVTGGELYNKLFTLSGSHDSILQPRINAVRESPEILATLTSKLDIGKDLASEEDLTSAVHYLNRLNKETSPKAKLVVLTKAHHAIANSLPKHSGDADTIFPLFVLSLTKSTAVDWWQNFMFIQRFRRASELVGQAAYCLTNLEAAIHVLEQFTLDSIPEGVDPTLFSRPIVNPRAPRERSSSQSSKGSSSNSAAATASFSQRLGETLNSYRTMLVATRKPQPHQQQVYIEQRFLNADADALTLGDVKLLLKEYKRLAEFVDSRKSPSLSTVTDNKNV